MKQSFTLLLLMPIIISLVHGQNAIFYANSADFYQNSPKQILQTGIDSFYTFTFEKCNPIQLYSTTGKKTQRYSTLSQSADYARFKQNGDEWAAMFQTSYDDIGFFPGLLYLHGKKDNIEYSLDDGENSFFENGNQYYDFTFYNEDHFICLPSYRIIDNVQYPALPYWYIVNFNGEVTDSISAWIQNANCIDRFKDYWIIGDGSRVYVFQEDMQLIWEKEMEAYDRCYIAGNFLVFARHTNMDVVKKLDGTNLLHKEFISEISQNIAGNLVWLEENQIVESEVTDDTFTYTSQVTLAQRDTFMQLVNGTANRFQLAGQEPEYGISEFRSYIKNQTELDTLLDLSIGIEQLDLIRDTFMIHIWGSDTIVEYKQMIHFELQITNKSDIEANDILVYSDIFGAVNCGIGYYEMTIPKLSPFESMSVKDSITYYFNPDQQFCFYIPSINDKPDLDKNDNSVCRLLTVAKVVQPSNIQIYPNPASDIVHIQGTSGKCQVNLFTMSGQKVLSFQDEVSIDLTGLMDGLYWIQIIDGKQTFTQKIVIVR